MSRLLYSLILHFAYTGARSGALRLCQGPRNYFEVNVLMQLVGEAIFG
jgi:hypothetical protein